MKFKVTSNGGIAWNSLTIPSQPTAGFVYNQSTVYLTSYPNVLLKSTNSGASWNTINSNLEFSPQSGEWNSTFCFVITVINKKFYFKKLHIKIIEYCKISLSAFKKSSCTELK